MVNKAIKAQVAKIIRSQTALHGCQRWMSATWLELKKIFMFLYTYIIHRKIWKVQCFTVLFWMRIKREIHKDKEARNYTHRSIKNMEVKTSSKRRRRTWETTTIVVNMNMKMASGKASHDCVAHKLISKGSFKSLRWILKHKNRGNFHFLH